MENFEKKLRTLLLEFGNENSLTELEVEKIVVLVLTVTNSAPHIREIFFYGIQKKKKMIQDVLNQERDILIKKIDKKGGGILN